jgi:hypothetical protein
MLKVPAPFPQVGSFALFIDENLPRGEQRAELVRIMRRYRMDREAPVAIAFPNRTGATGNTTTTVDQLIDASPLTVAERAEHAELEKDLRKHARARLTPAMKDRIHRAEALRKRAIWSTILESELAVMRTREAGQVRRDRGSIGRPLPRDAEEAA